MKSSLAAGVLDGRHRPNACHSRTHLFLASTLPSLSLTAAEAYLRKLEEADLARRRALEAQERGLQFVQQAHTQLERSQPERAERAEAKALQVRPVRGHS